MPESAVFEWLSGVANHVQEGSGAHLACGRQGQRGRIVWFMVLSMFSLAVSAWDLPPTSCLFNYLLAQLSHQGPGFSYNKEHNINTS
jgi:hypothetical protein